MEKQSTSEAILWGAKIPWGALAFFIGCPAGVLAVLSVFQAACLVVYLLTTESE